LEYLLGSPIVGEHNTHPNMQQLARERFRFHTARPNGRGLIHNIGRNAAAPMDAWSDKHVFPGAEPPSLRQMMEIFEAGRMSVLDVENRLPRRLSVNLMLASCDCGGCIFAARSRPS
jgi:hypothetical protein